MEEFTKEELRWIIKQAKDKQKTAVGLPLLTKMFEIERKAVKKFSISSVGRTLPKRFSAAAYTQAMSGNYEEFVKWWDER